MLLSGQALSPVPVADARESHFNPYAEVPAIEQAFRRIVVQVRAIPGVERAAAGSRVPMWGGHIMMSITVDGRAPNPDRVQMGAEDGAKLLLAGLSEQ